MARETLHQFLLGLSSDAAAQEQFQSNPQQMMADAGLSEEEQKIVLSGSDDAIRGYLGDDLGFAAQIKASAY